MAIELFQSVHFQSQFESTEFSPAELTVVRARAKAMLSGFEADYATMCAWFGVAAADVLGNDNRAFVTLIKK